MSNEHPMDRAVRLAQDKDQRLEEARQRNYTKTERLVQPILSSEDATAKVSQVADQWRTKHGLPTMAEEAAQREAQRAAYAQENARRDAATMAAVNNSVLHVSKQEFDPNNLPDVSNGLDALNDAKVGAYRTLDQLGKGMVTVGSGLVENAVLKPINAVSQLTGNGKVFEGVSDEFGTTTNVIGKWLEDKNIVATDREFQDYYQFSRSHQAAAKQREEAIKKAETPAGKAAAAFWHTAKNPNLMAETIGSTVPLAVGGGLVGRGIAGATQLGGATSTALGMAAVSTPANIQETYQEKGNVGITDASWDILQGLGEGAAGIPLAKATGGVSLEHLITNGGRSATSAGKNIAGAMGGNTAKASLVVGAEAGSEGFQGGVGNAIDQFGDTGKVDLNQVGVAFGLEAAGGLGMAAPLALPKAFMATANTGIKEISQARHNKKVDPSSTKYDPAYAYNHSDTLEAKDTAMATALEGLAEIEDKLANTTDPKEKAKLEKQKKEYESKQVQTLASQKANEETAIAQSTPEEVDNFVFSLLESVRHKQAAKIAEQVEQARTLPEIPQYTGTVGSGGSFTIDNTSRKVKTSYGKEVTLSKIKTASGKEVEVATEYAGQFQGFINDLEAIGYKINDLGGFSDRANVNNKKYASKHADGYAIDINYKQNPNIKGASKADRQKNPTKYTDMPVEQVRALANKWGLGWGFDWNSGSDAMHFSVARNEGGKKLTTLPNGAPVQAATANGNAAISGVKTSWQGTGKWGEVKDNSKWDSLMTSTYSKYNFTLAEQQILKAQIGAESNFVSIQKNNPWGAGGLAQFIDRTAKKYGINKFDPAQALDGQARYMRDLLNRYGGDWAKALAAYNTGEGNVDKHWGKDGTGKGGGVMTLSWNGDGQTLKYVQKILHSAQTMTLNGQGGAITTSSDSSYAPAQSDTQSALDKLISDIETDEFRAKTEEEQAAMRARN